MDFFVPRRKKEKRGEREASDRPRSSRVLESIGLRRDMVAWVDVDCGEGWNEPAEKKEKYGRRDPTDPSPEFLLMFHYWSTPLRPLLFGTAADGDADFLHSYLSPLRTHRGEVPARDFPKLLPRNRSSSLETETPPSKFSLSLSDVFSPPSLLLWMLCRIRGFFSSSSSSVTLFFLRVPAISLSFCLFLLCYTPKRKKGEDGSVFVSGPTTAHGVLVGRDSLGLLFLSWVFSDVNTQAV